MPLTIQVKIFKLGNSLRMTIPIEVVRALNLKAGDFLEIGLDNSHMTVKRTEKE